jgi:hypothetical protein
MFARIWHAEGWPNRSSDSGGCRMDIRSRAFERQRACAVYSVTHMFGSCGWIGAQKNDLQLLRTGSEGVVRPTAAACSRPVECRISDCSGIGSAARRVPPLWHREARSVRFSGGQCAFHQTLCFLCGSPLPPGIDPRCCQRTQARLGHGQGAGEAVHAGPAQACRHAGSPSGWHGRDLDPQGPQLSHRSQRLGSQTADLVWRHGSFRGQHGAVLRVAGPQKESQNPARRYGHVETVPQRHQG